MTATAAGRLSATDRMLVRALPLFQKLSEPALDVLLAGAVVTAVPTGTVLFVQEDPADRFCVALDGWVKLYRLTEEGGEAVVDVVAPGESFAEAAMFANIRFPVTAETVSDARILSVPMTGFVRAIDADRGIVFAMLGSLSLRLRHLVHNIEQIQVKSAPQRVGGFLLRFCPPGTGPATFRLPFDKALIARRLAMQPETLSRALAKLRPVGVAIRGAVVTVEDPAALRAFSAAERE
jgi:CRP/FNR family transcriptional regulator, dissimilatory nitrate respiration regulator